MRVPEPMRSQLIERIWATRPECSADEADIKKAEYREMMGEWVDIVASAVDEAGLLRFEMQR